MRLVPLSQSDIGLMAALMEEEEQAWRNELDWDYAPIRRILLTFLKRRMLPGFVLKSGRKASGYSYFLVTHQKGVIGAIYAGPPNAQEAADRILSRVISSLKEIPNLNRIESQILPLNGLDPNAIFSRHGFRHFLRHYLELDLAGWRGPDENASVPIAPWHSSYLAMAAEVAFLSYRNAIDRLICEDYGSEANCEVYLRSLVESPGCGVFLPESSLVGLNSHGELCGFILTSHISPTAAMIPQISIHPAFQGRGLGTRLIRQSLQRLRTAGYQTVRLTVTAQNRRAHEWYQRLGFKTRRDFGAHVWLRE